MMAEKRAILISYYDEDGREMARHSLLVPYSSDTWSIQIISDADAHDITRNDDLTPARLLD